jgi:serine protease Do
VSIDVTQKIRRPRLPDISEDDPFYEFFRRFGQIPRRGGPGGEREYESQSTGSGFILSGDGYVVTNAHVVEDSSEVTVRLTDRREFTAKVIGSDKRTDVALLKVDAKDLPRVVIGDPDKLKVGEWVVAIGKPFGLENTMTAASSARRAAICRRRTSCRSSRRTSRSIRAIPADRCSTCAARSSASTR